MLTTVAGSPHLGCDLRIVLLIGPDGEEQIILASTDTNQHAEEVAQYYRLRYQIEFAIRDAKQHTGLTHCQARSQEKLDFHLNMSVASVNMLRLLVLLPRFSTDQVVAVPILTVCDLVPA
jgi:hypothetical protein